MHEIEAKNSAFDDVWTSTFLDGEIKSQIRLESLLPTFFSVIVVQSSKNTVIDLKRHRSVVHIY